MKLTATYRSIRAVWPCYLDPAGERHGGQYVDLYFYGASVPTEVINVWDRRAGAPTIEPTQEALAATLREWWDENLENLAAYRAASRYHGGR